MGPLLAQQDAAQLGGLVGLAAWVMSAIGEAGVGVLTLIETVFPPIPSEIILPLAGFLSATGSMNLTLAILAATVGSYLGALVLYALARGWGTNARCGCCRNFRWSTPRTSRRPHGGSVVTVAGPFSSDVWCPEFDR